MNHTEVVIISIFMCLLLLGASAAIFKTEIVYLYYTNNILPYTDPSNAFIKSSCINNNTLSSEQKLDCIGDFAHDVSLVDSWRAQGICSHYAPLTGAGSTAIMQCNEDIQKPKECGIFVCFQD